MDFVGQDKRSICESSRVVLQRGDGTTIESGKDPERSLTVTCSPPRGTTCTSLKPFELRPFSPIKAKG